VAGRRGALPEDPLAFVDLKARSLEVLNDPFGALRPGIVGCMLPDHTGERKRRIGGRLGFRPAPQHLSKQVKRDLNSSYGGLVPGSVN
jgi:hypothetical protein